MTDDRDYLERAQSFSEKLHGERPSVNELVDIFALYGPEQRAAELDRLDADLNTRDTSVRRAAELHDFRRRMKQVHATLLKARQ